MTIKCILALHISVRPIIKSTDSIGENIQPLWTDQPKPHKEDIP